MNPWDLGSPLYRRLVVSAMVLIGAGILLSVIAAAAGLPGLSWPALAVIAAGLLTHLAGLVVRARDARTRHAASQGAPDGRAPRRRSK
jgi:membrane protein implicated in regulation of membrane protease activity